ncbi:MAG: 50S ribosomal protein L24, partial [Rickettsiales bacterium]|nr:50S ribosomal protein L24 [Rickettsiales bacterium]
VVVISGKYKGVSGEVIAAYPTESKVVVAGVNRRKWHIKPTQDKPGHIDDHEAPIHVSNVAIVDAKTKKPTRVGYKMDGDKKVRVAKKSGEVIVDKKLQTKK